MTVPFGFTSRDCEWINGVLLEIAVQREGWLCVSMTRFCCCWMRFECKSILFVLCWWCTCLVKKPQTKGRLDRIAYKGLKLLQLLFRLPVRTSDRFMYYLYLTNVCAFLYLTTSHVFSCTKRQIHYCSFNAYICAYSCG